jgi:glycosyltransferase involved in cell wall biosynthesis
MKNVLMIVYADYIYDTRVRREAETLVRTNKFRVSVIGLKHGKFKKASFLDGVQLIEINEQKYFGNNKLRHIFSYLKFLVLSLINCTSLFLKDQVDIVHVHNMPDLLVFAALIPWIFGRKLVLDIHDSMPETYLDKYRDKSSITVKLLCLEESVCASMAHKVICVNHVQKEILLNRGIAPEKLVISMNVPDPFRFSISSNPGPIVLQNQEFHLIYHGTIAWRLGVDLIIQAVGKLSNTIPGLKFHLWAKSCPALDSIEQLSKSLQLDHKVAILRGGVRLERLADELKIMNIGIIGNRKGVATDIMLPVKMLEYVSLGIPVVAPRLKCIQHYFSEGMVSFFEPENVESMASAILTLYQDPGRRVEKARQARAFLDRYGWEKHKYDLIRMYDNL